MPRGFTYKHCSVAKEHPHLKGCPPHTFGSTSYIWSNVIQMSTHQASQDGIGHLRILCWFECAEMVENNVVVVSPHFHFMVDQIVSPRAKKPALSSLPKAPWNGLFATNIYLAECTCCSCETARASFNLHSIKTTGVGQWVMDANQQCTSGNHKHRHSLIDKSLLFGEHVRCTSAHGCFKPWLLPRIQGCICSLQCAH